MSLNAVPGTNRTSYSFNISKNSRLQGSRAIDLDRATEDMSVSKSKYFQLVVHAASMCTSTSSLLPALLRRQKMRRFNRPVIFILRDRIRTNKQILELAVVANFPLLHWDDGFQFETLCSELIISSCITSRIRHSGTHQQPLLWYLSNKNVPE